MAFIEFNGPFDLAATLESGQAFRWRREAAQEGGPPWFEGVVFSNVVRIQQDGEVLEWTASPDSEQSLAPILRDYLRLDEDFSAITSALEFDDTLRAGFAEYAGLRILRQEPWECLVSFICSANNNIPRITKNVEDMASAFGTPIQGQSGERNAFPSPAQLADAGETSLRELGLGFRAKYVAAAARRVAEGEFDLYSLREVSYQDALDTLAEFAGVGDKVANCVLLFSMDKLEAFPVDVWIDRALRDWYFSDSDEKISRNKMRTWAQARFGEHAGYANQYLFHGRRLRDRN